MSETQNVFVVSRFLTPKFVTWESQNPETFAFSISLVKIIELFVVAVCESAL